MSPALIFYAFEVMKKSPKKPMIKLSFEVSVFIFALMVGLPASIAMFPQTGSIKPEFVEKEILKNNEIKKVKMVYYNKGL